MKTIQLLSIVTLCILCKVFVLACSGTIDATKCRICIFYGIGYFRAPIGSYCQLKTNYISRKCKFIQDIARCHFLMEKKKCNSFIFKWIKDHVLISYATNLLFMCKDIILSGYYYWWYSNRSIYIYIYNMLFFNLSITTYAMAINWNEGSWYIFLHSNLRKCFYRTWWKSFLCN